MGTGGASTQAGRMWQGKEGGRKSRGGVGRAPLRGGWGREGLPHLDSHPWCRDQQGRREISGEGHGRGT